jgi:hypothetical protein
MEKVDLLIRDGEVWTPGGFFETDIAVRWCGDAQSQD